MNEPTASTERRTPAGKAYEHLAAQIQQAILGGTLPPGSRLPDEAAFAAQHSVGRSTVREAFRVLSGRGWIHTTRGPGGGVFVSRPDPVHVGRELGHDLAFLVGGDRLSFSELLEARYTHENTAVALAARRAGPAEVQHIRKLAEDAEQWVDDTEGFAALNLEFHLAISEATHNRVLLLWMSAIRQVLRGTMTAAASTRERRLHVVAQHLQIAEAIATGDPDVARNSMHDHLNDFEADYLALSRDPDAS